MREILIVGAGPGGASLAFLLARRGIDVVLFERQTDFAREFRGEVLLPGGLDAFRQMGLAGELDAVPHVTLDGAGLYINGKLRDRTAFDDEAVRGLKPRWTSQPALLEMLVDQSKDFPSFRFERGARVRNLLERDGRVVGVELADGSEVRGGFVIGADGRTSIVRRRSGVPVRADPTPMDIVWCKLPMPEFFASDPHLRAYVGHGHLLITAPVYDDHMQIAWIIAKGSFGEIRERGMPDCLDRMAAHVSPDLAEHLKRYRSASVQPFVLSTVSDRVEQWTRPGMLLIGDAAHTMSPVGAQGLNIAVRDAIVAANHLVPAVDNGAEADALDEAARRVEQERLPEVSRIQRMQALPPRVILRDTWWARLLISVAPLLVGPGMGGRRRRTAFDQFAFGVTDVRLTV